MRRPRTARAEIGHADDWLMTYADMITLLLCLFMVLLSSSMAKRTVPPVYEQIRVAAAGRLAFPVADYADTTIDGSDQPAPESNAVLPAAPIVPPAAAPAAPQSLKAHQTAPVAPPQGSRITTVQMSSAAFFEVGSAEISEAGRSLLQQMAGSLASPRFADYRVTVEGHTDDEPIRSALFPSNWELSTARASAVVHFFIEHGIAPQRLRAAGYADSFPLMPNRAADGTAIPENQARNRRVVIRLERIDRG